MVRTYKTVSTPREITDHINCDWCGKIIDDNNLTATCEKSDYTGDDLIETTFDICAECFDNGLVPLLAVYGLIPQVRKW